MPPDEPQVQLARDWMVHSQRDLRMARLALGDSLLSGLVAFHCQQAAEKALKAFLAWKDQPVPRTHDLPALLARCRPLEPRFAELNSDARALDIYVTVGYPDSGPEPSTAEAEEALKMAEAVVSFVADILPRGTSE